MTDKSKIILWDEEQFNNGRDQWSELLSNSNSDKLFMSWEWLHSWWNSFSSSGEMSLYIVAAYNSNNKLVGLAPLYLTSVVLKNIFPIKRMEFLGNCWRGDMTMRTELLDFIVDNSVSKQVIASLFEYINNVKQWDEFVLSDLDINSETYAALVPDRAINRSYYRVAEEFDSFYLPLVTSFDEFSKLLGKNTRLKLLNRRKVLEGLGEVKYKENRSSDVDSSFRLLNELHIQRWGSPVFENERLQFNTSVAKLMADKGQVLFSTLYLDDKPISIQYNYIIDGHEYNIQAGFIENFHSKLSLGYMHFGYAIEASYNKKLRIYDFLAGEGKNTQYKARLTQESVNIVSLQIIRSQPIKFIYYLYDIYIKLINKK